MLAGHAAARGHALPRHAPDVRHAAVLELERGLLLLGVEDELFRAGATPGATVVIGEGDGVVFDWQPSLSSAAELMTAPRGTDPRIDPSNRRTTSQRREQYRERMDAKAEARADLEAERLSSSGWSEESDG